MLSFLYFDPDFIQASIKLGQHDAQQIFEGLAPGEVPWRTE